MSRPGAPHGRDVIAALERQARRTSGAEGSPHGRIDSVLQGLAAEEVEAIVRVQERWVGAGHPAGSFPEPEEMQADDTGNVVDSSSQRLIATPDEWQVFTRIQAALAHDGEPPAPSGQGAEGTE